MAQGGLKILFGNIAPDGAVIKSGAVDEDCRVFCGKARCFESETAANKAILEGKIGRGEVIVIRYEGPKGAPGMPEMLAPTSNIVGMGLGKTVALITDGRFSGGTAGICVGHISPEAAAGGPIAAIREGEKIRIDIPAGIIGLPDVSDGELTARTAKLAKFGPKVRGGWLARYANLVSSASYGAVLKAE